MIRPVIIVLKEQVLEDAKTLVRVVSSIKDMADEGCLNSLDTSLAATEGLLFATLLLEEAKPSLLKLEGVHSVVTDSNKIITEAPCLTCGRIENKCKKCD